MKLLPIFTQQHSEEGLWSIQLDERSQSEFEKFFDKVNDTAWLYDSLTGINQICKAVSTKILLSEERF